ncbi:MAG: hypothetical protein N3E37_03825 [Candidatus Micrarchaeota archaeon]|nr:hypothetical protein [Candidatus Micrarchaeota archaeon]
MEENQKLGYDPRIFKIIGIVFVIVVVVGLMLPFLPFLRDYYIMAFNVGLLLIALGFIFITVLELLKQTKKNLIDINKLFIEISEYLKTLLVIEQTETLNSKYNMLKEELEIKRKMQINPFTHGFFETVYLALLNIQILYNEKFYKKINQIKKIPFYKRIYIEITSICFEKNFIDFESVIIFDKNIMDSLFPGNFIFSEKELSYQAVEIGNPVNRSNESTHLDNLKVKISTYDSEKCKTFINKYSELLKLAESAGFTGIITINNYLILFYYPRRGFDYEQFSNKVKNSIQNGTLLEAIKIVEKL